MPDIYVCLYQNLIDLAAYDILFSQQYKNGLQYDNDSAHCKINS